MTANSTALPLEPVRPLRQGGVLPAIAAAGLLAGTLDLIQAFILFGRRVPLAIAAGLLGTPAFHGGIATYALGILLHFFIATSVAAVYYVASRKLIFSNRAPAGLRLVLRHGCGIGILPLSALHANGPYSLHDVLLGLAARDASCTPSGIPPTSRPAQKIS